MANINPSPEISIVKKPFYFYLKSIAPYAVITLILFFVFATSDLPIFKWLPGKDYFTNYFLPYWGTIFTVLKNAFASKFVSWGLLISFSAGILFLFDLLFSRRSSV
jgi:hypothetical protein